MVSVLLHIGVEDRSSQIKRREKAVQNMKCVGWGKMAILVLSHTCGCKLQLKMLEGIEWKIWRRHRCKNPKRK